MKNFVIGAMSFALGAVAGAFFITTSALTMPEVREMTEEMSKHFEQI